MLTSRQSLLPLLLSGVASARGFLPILRRLPCPFATMGLLPPGSGAFLASVLLLLFPEARGDCGPPKSFPTAQIRPSVEQKENYPIGTKLPYICTSGYEPISGKPPVSECLGTSEWSDVSCQGRRCPIPSIPNGEIAGESDLRLGDQITFVCNEGYRTVGQNGARCVLRTGGVIWDHDPPHCERIPCYPPPVIANGNHNGQDDYVYGTVVTYRCDSQFSLIGAGTIVCKSDKNQNGEWRPPAPECKVVRCSIPEVSKGVMQTSYQPSYTYQDRIVFGCIKGYRLKDNRGDITCGANSTWQPRLPECILDIQPTTSPGGGGTSAGPTVRTPVRSTVKPVEETTNTEIGHTETPKLPPDEPGSNVSTVVIGAVVGVLAVVAIMAVALAYRARHKRRGKTIASPASPESYTAVSHNADIPLEEQPEPMKV